MRPLAGCLHGDYVGQTCGGCIGAFDDIIIYGAMPLLCKGFRDVPLERILLVGTLLLGSSRG